MRAARAMKTATLVAAVTVLAVGAVDRSVAPAGPSSADHRQAEVVKLEEVAGVVLSASAAGKGTVCSDIAPCAPTVALSRARAGDVVTLAAGSYPALKIVRTAARASSATPIVLRPVRGSTVTLAGLNLEAPGITVEDLTSTGTVYVHPLAKDTTLRRLQVDGAGVFLRADGSRLLDSEIRNGSSVDGVQIKDGSGILVQGNSIHSFDQLSGSLHADCIQLFDVRNVVIRGNTIYDCDNASFIFSGGSGKGIDNVLVESNFVGGCRVKNAACKGGTAIDLREKSARNVVLRHNTFAGGSVRIESTPGQVNDRNVFAYLSSCKTTMTNSVVGSWNTGLCRTPAALGRDGNRQGNPVYVDKAAMDLHVAESQRRAVTVPSVPVSYPAWATGNRDFDGQAFAPGTVGADEPGAGPTVVDLDPPAPAPAPVAPSPLRVAMAAPAGVVSGGTVLTATVTGGTAVTLRFSAGELAGANGTSNDGGKTWRLPLDSRAVPDGTYPVTATATDSAGRQATSAPVIIKVDN